MKIRSLKYLLSFSIPGAVAFSFFQEGWLSFFPLFYAFGFIPLMEVILSTDAKNMSDLERETASKDRVYDWLLYLTVPLQYIFLVWFIVLLSQENPWSTEFFGRIFSFGLLCGVLGINVAHELGHRAKKLEQNLAKLLLFTSLYGHFFIEHNQGHHKNVATEKDPASARYNEWLYLFWFRTIIFSFISAWKIEIQNLKQKKKSFFSLQNEMLIFMLIQLGFVLLVLVFTGISCALGFVLAGGFGAILLETVNYIEHYGLRRSKTSELRYENVRPKHSWNSNHLVGRVMLFELTRHSDHHANPHKKYQVLENHDENPQLPGGYPGMMLLSLLPPLFFLVMNPLLRKDLPAN